MMDGKNLDLQYLKKLENIEFQPVFILGLHRSGTSILYKMITETQGILPVTAYHLIRYNELLYNHINGKEETVKNELTTLFIEKGQMDRGIDKLKINADFAEEYGFLLGKKTNKMYLTKNNVAIFIKLAKKIKFISKSDKPILFKNPFDLSNFLYIKQVFPNAKFIFIHRHPHKTLSSFIKAVKHLYRYKNPYTTLLYKDYNRLYDNPLSLFLIRFIYSDYSVFGTIYLTLFCSKALKYYMKNIQKLSKNDFINLSYEMLCKNPSDTMEEIIKFLNIKTKKMDFNSFIKSRKTNLDPSVIKLQNFIYKNMKEYFDKCGYERDIESI